MTATRLARFLTVTETDENMHDDLNGDNNKVFSSVLLMIEDEFYNIPRSDRCKYSYSVCFINQII